VIVLVSGAPGSGKTTLARELAPKLRLPLIAKDDIKETLFEALGWPSDLGSSRNLGAGVWDVLFKILDRAVEADASIVLESNFHSDHRARFAEIDAVVVEVHCFAPPATLERRIRERERHPAHVDAELAFDGRELLEAHQPVVDRVIHVDTEEHDAIDVDDIVRRIREAGT